MELGQLKHFLAVKETGNFARAARACGVTQQALSSSIKRLERDLGTRLFIRGRNGATSTPGANAFAPFVRLAFTELSCGKQALIETNTGGLGEVHFGIGQAFSGHIVPDAIARLHKNNPKVSISMVEGYSEKLAEMVIEGELDFFVGVPPTKMVSDSKLKITSLFEISDQIVCGFNNPLARKKNVSIKDMSTYPWLLPSPPSAEEQFITKVFSDKNLCPPENVIYSDTIATAQALLVSGNYLLIGQPEILALLFEAEILTTLNTNIKLPRRTAYLGVRQGSELRPCVKNFVDIIIEISTSFK